MTRSRYTGATLGLARLLAAGALALPLTQLSAHAAGSDPAASLHHQAPRVSADQFDGAPRGPVSIDGGPIPRSGPVRVMLQLSGAPAAQTFAAARRGRASTAVARQRAQTTVVRFDAAQRKLLAPLGMLQAHVLYRAQYVYNGVAVVSDVGKLAQLRRLPGVTALHVLVPKTLSLNTSVPFIGAPQVWDSSGANATGKGIKVGIIDSGVDYIHEDLGGSGKSSDYATNDGTTAITANYPNKRVVGGIDLVGDNYNAASTNPAQLVPHPDPNPAPCYPAPYGPGGDAAEHGTHVAGIAAGNGVSSDGSTYTGPYNASLPFSTFKVAPGVAPQADIYAIRVFGCSGSTNEVVPALEWAVDHHLDVVNLSLGSNFGSADDPDAVASDNAVLAGVAVAEAAGNASDAFYNVSSPSASSHALSVASTVDSGKYLIAVKQNSPETATYEAATAAFGPPVSSTGISGDLVYTTPHNGCSAFPAGAFTGHIALIDRGVCTFKTKTLNAQNAGATGVILVNNRPGPPQSMGDDASITNTITIPTVMIRQVDGAPLETRVAGGTTVNVTLTSAIHISLGDTLSTFSSRGPRSLDSALKPDIAAPGDSILSARYGSGNDNLVLSGTSMATPHVAGGIALMRQLHPTWTVDEIKALLMNTATHDVVFEPADRRQYGLGRVGAGRIDLAQAATDNVLAYNADNPELVSVSFGAPEVVGSATLSKNIVVLNKGASAATYDISFTPAITVPGVVYDVPSSVSLGAGGATSLAVTLRADASRMTHTHDQTVSETQAGLPRAWISESGGYVTLTPRGGGVTLRVPVYAAPRPASSMSATSHAIDLSGGQTSGAIALQGLGVDTTASAPLPVGEASLVSALELQQIGKAIPGLTTTDSAANLRDVGVTSNVNTYGSVTNSGTELYFGLATYHPWTTPNPNQVEFDIYIYTNGHSKPDYVLYNTNVLQPSGDDSDVFVTTLVNLSTGKSRVEDFIDGVDAGQIDMVPFNTSMLVMPVSTADLGLTSGNSRIRYQVATSARGNPVDTSDLLTYDAAHPGLDLTTGAQGLPIYNDQPGSSIPFTYDPNAYAANNSRGVLLLHHHNTADNHAEVVTITPAVPVGPGPAATPELGSGELLATGLLVLGGIVLVRRRRVRRVASGQDDLMA